MSHYRSSETTDGRSVLNVRLLIISLVILVIFGAVAFVVRQNHVRRNADVLLRRSQELIEKGAFAEAQTWLRQYVQIRPDDYEARVLLAQVMDKSAETLVAKTRAVEQYNQAIGHFPDRVELRRRKAELLLETGRYGEAVSEATQLLSRSARQDDAKAHYVKALGLYRQLEQAKGSRPAEGVVGEVVGALKAALVAYPGHAELARALAEVYRDHSDPARPKDAEAVMDEMVSRETASAAAYLARHQYRTRYELAGADVDLRKAIELAPNDVNVLTAQGDAQIAAKAYSAAIQTFRRIVEDVAPSDRRGYVGLGRAYADQGDRAKAVEIWRLAEEKVGRNDVVFHLLVARALTDDARENPTEENRHHVEQLLQEARDLFRRMARDLTENQYGRIADAIDTLEGEYWLAIGQPAKAVPLLARVAQTSRRSDEFREDQAEAVRRWALLGEANAALRYWDVAADAYQHVVGLKVNSAQAELAFAVALHNAGRLQQAIDHYHRATQAQSAPPEAWFLLARAEFQRQLRIRSQRDWEPFERALKDAKRALGSSAEVMLVEAEATAAQGSTEEAAKILAKAVQADPKRVLSVAVLNYERWGLRDSANAALVALQRMTDPKQQAAAIATEAELLIRRKQPDAARRLLERRTKAAGPREVSELLARIAELELGQGNIAAARQKLRESYQAWSHNPWPLQRLGDLAIQVRDVNDLKYCEQELKSIEGDDSGLWRFFRAIRLLLEHPERNETPAPSGAVATSDDVLAEVNQLREFLVRTRSRWPATHILTGIIAERAGELDEAAAAYGRAVDLGSQNITLYERLVSLLYTQNRAAAAAQYLDRLQDSLYSSSTLWSAERTFLLQAGRFVELAKSAERGAEIRKDSISKVWLGHARTLAAQNESDPKQRDRWFVLAEQAFREATSGDGQKDFRTWAGLVWYHVQRRQLEQAREALGQMEKHARLDDINRSLALAQGYHLIGDIEQAERHYGQALKLSPRNVAALERQARFYLATNPAKAEAAFEKLCALEPGKNVYRFILAALWASSGEEADFQKAMDLLSKDTPGATDQSAKPFANRRLQAILLLQRGERNDDAEAARVLRQLVDETSAPAAMDRLLLAQLYERQDKMQEAQRQYEYLVEVNPPDSAHLEAYLYFLLRRGMQTEFQRYLARLEAIGSDKNSFRVVRLKAHALKKENRLADVESLVARYRDNGLAQAKDKQQKARVLLNAAALFDQLGMDLRAEQAFGQLLQQQLIVHPYRGYALWLGQKSRFADALRLCLKYAPSDQTANGASLLASILAAALGRAGPPLKGQEVAPADANAAEQRIAAALQKEPDERQLLFSVGALRHIQGRKAESEKLYRRLVELHSNDVAGLNNLALILSEEPQYRDQALNYINQALGHVPQSLELRDSLGLVLLNLGETHKAVEVLNQLVTRRKTNRRYLFHFAVANYRLGDLVAAGRALGQAKNLNLAEEVLTPNERQLLARLEADLSKAAPKHQK